MNTIYQEMTITGTCKNECPPCSAPPQVIVRDEKQTPPSLLLLVLGWPMLPVQGSAKRWAPALGNFVPAVAYFFCLVLREAFTQPGVHLLADLSALRPPRARARASSGEEVFAQRLMHAHSTLPPLILPLLLGHRSDLLRALMCATH